MFVKDAFQVQLRFLAVCNRLWTQLGSGRLGQNLDEGELEKIGQRVLREAEVNFKLEIRKWHGNMGAGSGGTPGLRDMASKLEVDFLEQEFKWVVWGR